MKAGNWAVVTLGLALVIVGVTGCETSASRSAQGSARGEAAATPAAEAEVAEVTEESVAAVTEESVPAEAAGAGVLSVDKVTLDLGVVEPGASVAGQYVLTNTGDGPLHIAGTGHSCQCTVAKLGTKLLQPGESTMMGVTYNAGQNPGKVTKRVWVNVKPPSGPRKLTMTFKAEVKRHIEAEPASWQFELRDVPGNSVPLTLKSDDGTVFRVTSVTVSGKVAQLSFDPASEQAEHTLPIEVSREMLRKTWRGAVSIVTTHPKAKTVSVPFTTLLPFRAEPRRKVFRNLDLGQEERAVITVVSNYGEAFELDEISSDKGMVEVVSRTAAEGGYKLTTVFKVPEKTVSRQLKDTLRVAIKGRPEDKLEVVYYGRTKSPTAR